MIVSERGFNISLKSMRFVSALSIVTLLVMLTGCGSVPVWKRDVATLDNKGKGLTIAEVDRVLGRSTILASSVFAIDGTTYTLRHYEISEPTGRVATSYKCQRNGNGCMSSFSPDYKIAPFAVVFVGIAPKLVAWGTLDDLSKSTDPQVIAVMQQLKASFSDDEFLRSNPGMRCELGKEGFCSFRRKWD